MKFKIGLALTLFFSLCLTLFLLAGISWIGIWTDVLFSILLSAITLWLVFHSSTGNFRIVFFARMLAIACAMLVAGIMLTYVSNPFRLNVLKARSFLYQRVDGRIFNAYFKPVGSYSGGYGNLLITETPLWFPLIERTVYYQRVVHHDFGDDTFEGQPIDNNALIKQYIRKEIVDVP